MKTNAIHRQLNPTPASPGFKGACLAFCNRMFTRLNQTKEALLAEYRSLLSGQEHMLELAINEAEALAWQTDFPYLVFPSLALEKVAAVASWQTRQQKLRDEAAQPDVDMAA